MLVDLSVIGRRLRLGFLDLAMVRDLRVLQVSLTLDFPRLVFAGGGLVAALCCGQVSTVLILKRLFCARIRAGATTTYGSPRLPVRRRCPNYFTTLILISPSGDLRGMTRRELEVLGFIIDGRTNQYIATLSFITERTVAAHLEHIRAKLDAPSRTVAAVRSLHLALYVPHQLTDVAA